MPPYARVCAHATRALTRAERVWVRVRANTTLLAGCQGLAGRGCGADTTNDLTGLGGLFGAGCYPGLGAGISRACRAYSRPC